VTKVAVARSEGVKARLRKTAILLAAGAVAALLLPTVGLSLGKAGNRARDCVAGEAALEGANASRIRFVVWCAVQTGEARFSVRRVEGAQVLGFRRRLAPTGPGARGSFRCAQSSQVVRCAGQLGGPLTLQVWIAVPPGTGCEVPVKVRTAEAIYAATPIGCTGSHRERAPHDIGYMRSFRKSFGLDLDLHGNRSAIDRRIRGLFRAWRRGDPVARVTTDELGLPLRAADARELEYRSEYLEQTATILEHWVPGHAAATYAGYDFDHEQGGIFYIGFTGDQDAQLAAFKSRFDLIAPGRIRPFPTPPTHSERQLLALEEEVLDWWTSHPDALDELGLDTLANEVEASSRNATRARRLLARRFGDEAPILVVHSQGGALL
jgi:hypothetical protein